MISKTTLCIFLALIVLLSACTPPGTISVQVLAPDYWPTEGWRTSTPEAQGMDSELLARMLENISDNETRIHSLLVIRNGYVVTEAYFHPYTRDTETHIQSVTKSVIGMLVGRAIGEGFISSEKEKLLDFYPNRIHENQSREKDLIQLKHLLSMSSGLECQEFSSSGLSMEQTQGWVQFMLDRPMLNKPGEAFGYCNGNAHLLSAILEKTTGMSAREFANQELFQPLGIAPVSEGEWWGDPQKITIAGYGLHLTSADMAKLAFLYLHNGKWDGQQIIPARWVADSTREHIQKGDGSGYGYLWTVYPEAGHYAALGLGGQQIHVYPSKNLIVVLTAALESYAEAPEIENLLAENILPAIKSGNALPENLEGIARFETAIEAARNPVQPVAPLSETAMEISNSLYSFDENPFGWHTLEFVFDPNSSIALVKLDDLPVQIGLDNIYRTSETVQGYEMMLRGGWVDNATFLIEYPYPLSGIMTLGELGESEFRFKFLADTLEVTAEQQVFGAEPIVIVGKMKAEE